MAEGVAEMTRAEAVKHFGDRCQTLANAIAQLYHEADDPESVDPDGELREIYNGCIDFLAREESGRRMVMPLIPPEAPTP